MPANERSAEHVLVCLSSAPSNARIIRTAARMAHAFDAKFTALFVETPDFAAATTENKQRLQEHRNLAQQLGAALELAYGEDVPHQIAEFARLSGVTKIVLGRSAVKGRHFFRKPTLTEALIAYAPEVDIHIIPDKRSDTAYLPRKVRRFDRTSFALNVLKSAGIFLGATVLGILLDRLGVTAANIIMVYILGVLLTSAATSHQIYSLVSSVASVIVFNFLFTSPRYTLTAYERGYPVTFIVMFLTAFITGTFAIQYKKQAGQSARLAQRTKILFDTDQLLSKADDRKEIISACARQLGKLAGHRVVIFEAEDGRLLAPQGFDASGEVHFESTEKELAAARWALEHNEAAGATTHVLGDTEYLYLAMRVNERVYGVAGIRVRNHPLDAFEYGIVHSILGECALALENEKNAREKEAAAVLARSEQLRANLLRTISHDLRTPLTSISGNASNLLSSGENFDEETRRQLYTDIRDDSVWLINLVENLLSATKIEEGRMTLRLSAELLSDIVEEAVQHERSKTDGHTILVSHEDDLLMVRSDAKLIVQVLVNLVDNAVKYSPKGSSIRIATKEENGMAVVEIADNGPGIPDEEKPNVFDKFYCGNHRIADNRRSIGLGLFLCESIVEAHGGTIAVRDNEPHGAVFRFTLPLEEIARYE